MGTSCFDDLLRAHSASPNRRAAGRLIAGLALGRTVNWRGLAEADTWAHGKKRKHGKQERRDKARRFCANKNVCTKAHPRATVMPAGPHVIAG